MSNTIEIYRGRPGFTKRGLRHRGQYRWRVRGDNGKIIASATEGYTEKRGAVENVAQVLGAGIHAGHHLIPDLEDRQAVEAAIHARYDVIDIGAVADYVDPEAGS